MISSVMISCSKRNDIREQTLDNLKNTDWDWDVEVILDHEYIGSKDINKIPPTTRQLIASFNAINVAVKKNKPLIVFMEDDLIFNKHIKHNILNWYPVKSSILNFGSLYTPKNNRCSVEDGEFWYKADCLKLYGSQFYIMSREAAKWAVKNWNTIEGLQDIRLTRLAKGKAIYYHAPSLVEHREVPSSWGGVNHRSHDFDEFWKHPT